MTEAHPTKSLPMSLPKFACAVAVVAIVSVMFSAGAAMAILRTAGPPLSPEYDPSSTSDPDARCRTSELTQDKFIELVHAIANHGDLTDKNFIEKTLQTRFGPPNTSFAYSHISSGGYYKATIPDGIPDAPIELALDIGTIDLDKAGKRELYSGLLLNHLDRIGAVFHDCKFLTRKQLDPKSEGVIEYRDTKRNTAFETWNPGTVAKTGTNIEVTYKYKTDGSDAIESIHIGQKSETNLNPIGERP